MILTSSHTLRAEDHSEVSAANGPSLITASRLNRKMYRINISATKTDERKVDNFFVRHSVVAAVYTFYTSPHLPPLMSFR